MAFGQAYVTSVKALRLISLGKSRENYRDIGVSRRRNGFAYENVVGLVALFVIARAVCH